MDAFLSSGRANEKVSFSPSSPRVKVERTLTKVIEQYGHLPIESVHIDGRSGCEFFRGEVTVRTGTDERAIDFHWDCKWRAMEQGWTDYFGLPDQIRAAQEFGYQCFRSWEEHTIRTLADA